VITFPVSRGSFRASRTAAAIILAAVLLATLLAVVTWRNLDREERLMKEFLLREGQTLIRTFEAGARAWMMHRQSDPLIALVEETAREDNVAYIRIVDEEGKELAVGGEWAEAGAPEVSELLASQAPLTRFSGDDGKGRIYEIAREFRPLRPGRRGRRHMRPPRDGWPMMGPGAWEPPGRLGIMVGLYTREFDEVRRSHVRRSLFMGGILFLAGSAGFYLLFLSQEARVARATVENMEIYTQNVLESMPAGLLTMDAEGRVVAGNPGALEILGRDAESLKGLALRDLTGADNDALVQLVLSDRLQPDTPLDCARPDGTAVPVKVSASRLSDRSGNPMGMVIVLRDMREIRAMEERLERSRRLAALGRMAAGVAHEIRNPLSTLKGFAQFFGTRAAGDEAAVEYAGLMVGEVDRLNRTVSALLQFARQREPQFTDLSINELMHRAAALVADDFSARNLSLNLVTPDPELILRADPDLLTQVLLNLLQNAAAATGSGGVVELGAAVPAEPPTALATGGQGVRVWVRDSGEGISPDERQRIFDPFYTTRRTGTGLGLAVVHQIVEQHGGRIEVDSLPGEGATITFYLPGGEGAVS